MPDIASLGLEINTSQIVEGKKALDQFADSSVKVDQAARNLNGQMGDAAKILRAQAEQARASAAANTALGMSSNQASIGAQLFIEKLQEQVAVLGMSRSQLAAYQAAQLGVSKEAEASVAKLKAYEDAIKAAADAKAAATKQTNVLTDAIKLLAAGYGALKLGEYIRDAALLAARYETLGVVATVVGKNAGYTKTQMDTATEAIAAQGITMIESRQSAIKLVQAHVDLRNATALARIAQDAAVIGNINSSEAFDRLVNGIARGNVLILRNIGINVNLQSAYEQMAASLGKGTKELTENERVQARLNAVMERGTDINGTYTAAMDTAGKQIKSMQRYTEDLKTVIGETFNEVLTIGVMALTDGLKGANKEASELAKNEQLHEWGRSLADVFIFLVNKIGNATTLMQKTWAWADHMSARDDINSAADSKITSSATQGELFDVSGRNERIRRIKAERDAALAEENVAYLTQQASLSAQFDKFAKAGAEREEAITAKRKAEAEARFKVDQDYAAKATAILLKSANEGAAAQEAARKSVVALHNAVYIGTPTYKETEGREPKPKVDKVESTELADRLARIQDAVNAEKEMYETMSKMDDMFHAAGKMGDEEYYKNKRDYAKVAADDLVNGYTKQIADIKAYHNSTEAEAAKYAKQIADIEAKRATAVQRAADEESLLGAKEFLRKEAIATASGDATNRYLSSLDQEAKKLEEANAAHETSRGAVERETIARLDLAIAYQKQFIADQAAAGATAEEIAQAPATLKYLEDVRAARARIAAGLDEQQANQFKDKAAEQAIKDWDRAGRSISDSLTGAFGKGGKALGEMFQAYSKGMEGQLRAQKELAAAKKLADDNPAKIDAINRAHVAGAQAQIQGYAGMTSAAQGFFSEGSRGYQAMHAATVALQSAEVALSLIKGVNAVLTQGAGDPYSAFARMAAMAAIVVGLGVAISGGGGGGGGQTAAEVQKVQGTGSVFGDKDAKSESIARSLERMEQHSGSLIPLNQGMLSALRSIEANMKGLANLVVRTPGVTDGSNMSIQTGTIKTGGAVALVGSAQVGSMIGGFLGGPLGMYIGGAIGAAVSKLWGKTTQNIVDSGVQFGGSVRGLQSGQGYNQYASVDTTKSSFFGLSKKTSNSVQTAGLSDELSSQFGLIFTNVEKALSAAAVGMGIGADHVTSVLDALTIETTKVSLKGLTGDALTAALNGVISKAMDDMASAVFPEMDKFRQVGEGYTETVVRLASNYARVDQILGTMGATFGAVGIDSLTAREKFIDLAGGMDALNEQASTFAESFLTEAERLAPVQKYVTDQLGAMGLASLDTRDKFKNYITDQVKGGALLTESGAQQITSLMALAEAFALTHAATVDLTKSTQAIADERADLQGRLDQATMTSIQLQEQERASKDRSNQAFFDQVVAAEAARAAADALAATNAGYQEQIAAVLKARMSEVDQLALERAALDASTVSGFDRLNLLKAEDKANAEAKAVAEKAAAALAMANKSFEDQIATILRARMDEATGRDFDIKGMNASTVALYDRAHALQAEDKAATAATEAIKKAQDSAAAAQKSHDDAVATARSALAQAYERESSALETAIGKAEEFAKTMRTFSDSLKLGDLSTLSPEAKYAEAQRQFATATPEQLQGASTALLEASKAYNSNNEAYAKDYQAVQDAIGGAAMAADAQVVAAQAQLGLMAQQVAGIADVNKSVLSLPDALAAYLGAVSAPVSAAMPNVPGSAIGAAGALKPGYLAGTTSGWTNTDWDYIAKQSSIDGSHLNGLDSVPFDGYRAELHRGERVQTAAAVRDGDAAAKQTNELLRQALAKLDEANARLEAANNQRGAGITAQLEQGKRSEQVLAGTKRELARAEK